MGCVLGSWSAKLQPLFSLTLLFSVKVGPASRGLFYLKPCTPT